MLITQPLEEKGIIIFILLRCIHFKCWQILKILRTKRTVNQKNTSFINRTMSPILDLENLICKWRKQKPLKWQTPAHAQAAYLLFLIIILLQWETMYLEVSWNQWIINSWGKQIIAWNRTIFSDPIFYHYLSGCDFYFQF